MLSHIKQALRSVSPFPLFRDNAIASDGPRRSPSVQRSSPPSADDDDDDDMQTDDQYGEEPDVQIEQPDEDEDMDPHSDGNVAARFGGHNDPEPPLRGRTIHRELARPDSPSLEATARREGRGDAARSASSDDRMSVKSACPSGIGYDPDNELFYRANPPVYWMESKTIPQLTFKPNTDIDSLVEERFPRGSKRLYASKVLIRGCLSTEREEDDRDQHTGWSPECTVEHAWIEKAASRVFPHVRGVEELELIDLEWGDVPSPARLALRSQPCFTVLKRLHLVKIDFWNSNQLLLLLSSLCNQDFRELRVAGCRWKTLNHTRDQISESSTLYIHRLQIYEDVQQSSRPLVHWLLGKRDGLKIEEAEFILQSLDIAPILMLLFCLLSHVHKLELRFQGIETFASSDEREPRPPAALPPCRCPRNEAEGVEVDPFDFLGFTESKPCDMLEKLAFGSTHYGNHENLARSRDYFPDDRLPGRPCSFVACGREAAQRRPTISQVYDWLANLCHRSPMGNHPRAKKIVLSVDCIGDIATPTAELPAIALETLWIVLNDCTERVELTIRFRDIDTVHWAALDASLRDACADPDVLHCLYGLHRFDFNFVMKADAAAAIDFEGRPDALEEAIFTRLPAIEKLDEVLDSKLLFQASLGDVGPIRRWGIKRTAEFVPAPQHLVVIPR
ncbi:uncharacterized protein C8Q71DRAFT_69913 [Rhodofomes roseus]|uniref:Uncharacterized protein n=1 Tax=Rhodofomes roseus TaxID=34475 RepID=A0ABQ8KFV6_9APHY|nr:uncharacterized protein C8Q71DRAFT_69913 [Rhodofomes roseus]KAH9836176.1 hypothetical protein C8Q71DRAFT_69913 [Rhodofomes roseus]